MSHCSVLQAQPTELAAVRGPGWLQAQPQCSPLRPQSVPVSVCIFAILGLFILPFSPSVSLSNCASESVSICGSGLHLLMDIEPLVGRHSRPVLDTPKHLLCVRSCAGC